MQFKLNRKDVEFQNMIPGMLRANNTINSLNDKIGRIKTITFQLTEDCNLCCTYCYQINKSKNILPFEYAKKFIDLLIEDSYKDNTYVSLNTTEGVIVEFIGGEPLLEIELMDKITDYFRNELIKRKHPWIRFFRISMISNGILYKSKEFQKYLEKNKDVLSFSISLDGCKELHDSCRVFEDGTGSYDTVIDACKDYMRRYNPDMYTKMTFAPENIEYTYTAITNLISLGYKVIQCNPIYEDKWTIEHAKIYYNELKKVTDFLIENDLYHDIFIRAFEDNIFKKVDTSIDNRNYCGSTGFMMALDYKGDIYPCVRFMKSSLGENGLTPFKIGDIWNGINVTPPDKERVNILDSITLTSQSDDECINCPIGMGCGWCTANNYQITGTPNKRVKSICGMHKARSLANIYYWNLIYKKGNYSNKPFKMNIPKEWALEIISEEEYNMLYELQK